MAASIPSAALATITEDVQRALSRGGPIEITTTGRRTGLGRRIPIVFHNIAGRMYISGMPSRRRRSWLANVAADPHMTVHVFRGVHADLPATARVIEDDAERRAVLAHVARAWRREDVETMVGFSPLIEFTLDDRPA